MNQKTKILYVDDEPAYCRIFKKRIGRDPRFMVETAESGEAAIACLESFMPDIVLTDLQMPFMDGIELLEQVKKRYPATFVVILTGVDSTEKAVRAMKAGAYDYLLKPLDFEMVIHSLETIRSHKTAFQCNPSPNDSKREDFRFENIIGQDRKMFEIFEKINQVAKTSATVLITGESGTGKDLIASAIHAKSQRSANPFIQVNCAALSEGLIASELFGHEKGAFTGAVSRKKGLFEQASGGTLFLDEIGDISMTTQVSLLRILELGTFQRVGGTETIKADVRIICATNRDLAKSAAEKLFREDLYYRLNVVSIHSPSLRDRKSDIPLLANYFFERYCEIHKKPVQLISPETMELLCNFNWPGNCRELANVIEHSVVFCRDTTLVPDYLPELIKKPVRQQTEVTLNLHSSTLAEVESSLIRKVLEEKNWNLKQVAESLDIARGTLYSKMEKYGITKPE